MEKAHFFQIWSHLVCYASKLCLCLVFFAEILTVAGKRGSQQVRIFNGKTESYLMIEKTRRHTGVSYSVSVAPRNGVSIYTI